MPQLNKCRAIKAPDPRSTSLHNRYRQWRSLFTTH